MAVNNWKGALHFTPGNATNFIPREIVFEFHKFLSFSPIDACPLQIFLAQVENYEFDLIAAVDIADILLQFVQYIVHTDSIPLRSENLDSCNCCMKLVRFAIKTLCKCSEMNLTATGNFNPSNVPMKTNVSCNLRCICAKHSPIQGESKETCIREIYREMFSDENVWTDTKRKQSKVLRDGIKFLSHLAICDPDFVIRLTDIEDSFHLFMRNLNAFENFLLHENERECSVDVLREKCGPANSETSCSFIRMLHLSCSCRTIRVILISSQFIGPREFLYFRLVWCSLFVISRY